MRRQSDRLSAVEKDALRQRVLHGLDEAGVGVGSAVALDLLAQSGARVGSERHAATLPPELVESCLDKAPGSVRLAARAASRAEVWLAAHVTAPIPEHALRAARTAFDRYARGAGSH